MNKKLFVEFYKIGLELSQSESPPPLSDYDDNEIDGETMPNQYAFYFSKLCMIDIKGRSHKEWGMMGWLEWKIFQIGYFFSGLFQKKHKKDLTPPEQFAEELSGKIHAMIKSVKP